ncbi:hypothetical protein QVN96_08250 [Mediterraneibacter glycyrrhizinilyticus]|uniref:hypothetical protein n=1 Tax=Mediterraneibacter glycyrrhizinilyticus TaxID=342942 RepID=UPI0025AA3B6B|nr:hypothetical protein [Mediterraneibacter glycyrrhizinilyticus]MDN0061399.1 hypothetical protein [Mediterraneibacter glycyrrhizinilyticus]
MRKIKIFSIILFICSAAVYIGCRIYAGVMTDHTPPVISGGDAIEVSVEDPKEKLLEGMTAEDDRDGDVTDSLVVQEISEFDDEGNRTVRYAAVDDSGNVGYYSRTMTYTDYGQPTFAMSSPLRFPMGTSFNICEGITASSVLDGDLSDKIKYTLDRAVSNATTGTYDVEFRVMDSAGRTSYLKTVLEVYDPSEERIEVTLSDYLVYIRANSEFHASAYFEEASVDGDLDIQSTVNTSKAGVYYTDYVVTDNRLTGKSRLVVVVR